MMCSDIERAFPVDARVLAFFRGRMTPGIVSRHDPEQGRLFITVEGGQVTHFDYVEVDIPYTEESLIVPQRQSGERKDMKTIIIGYEYDPDYHRVIGVEYSEEANAVRLCVIDEGQTLADTMLTTKQAEMLVCRLEHAVRQYHWANAQWILTQEGSSAKMHILPKEDASETAKALCGRRPGLWLDGSAKKWTMRPMHSPLESEWGSSICITCLTRARARAGARAPLGEKP